MTSWNLSISGAAVFLAGANVNDSIKISGAALANWSEEAEGDLCMLTSKDWVANYSSVGANFKPALAETCSCMIAMKIINYDMSAFPMLAEAQTRLDFLQFKIDKNLAELKTQGTQGALII